MSQEEVDNLALEFNAISEKITNASSSLEKLKLRNHQNEIINKLQFIVEQYTKKYKKFSNYQDLYQVGQIGLLNALKTFKIDKSSFSWWAQKYIKLMLSRNACQHSSFKIPLKDARETKPIKVSTFPRMASEDDHMFEDLYKKQFHNKIIKCIDMEKNEKNKQILKLFYGDKTYQHKISEIQEKMSSVSRLEANKIINNFNKKIVTLFKA